MQIIKSILLIGAVIFLISPVLAAKPSGLGGPTRAPEFFNFDNPVQQVQDILKKLGFYDGPSDGLVNDGLDQAIRNYESAHGLKPTGKVTEALLDHLENIGRVRALLQRLDVVRERKQKEAREALLANPRTRALLKDQKQVRPADPTRDKDACFKSPSTVCLLSEAVASSHGVFEEDLRDWALGEILAAQVQANMADKAIETAARIKDTRLIIAALAKIAITQAREGQIDEALSGLDLIPLVDRKISVLLEIAKMQWQRDERDAARKTLAWALRETLKIELPQERFSVSIEALHILALMDSPAAIQNLTEMMHEIRLQLPSDAKEMLLRQSASAMADFKNPEFALKTLDELPDDEARTPVLMSATRAFLDMRRFQAAQSTLARISEDRYRSVILSDVALALWQNDRPDRAQAQLEEAVLLARNIKLPFARNFALSRVAETLTEMVFLSGTPQLALKAYETLSEISDDRIKARGLWALAHTLDRKNITIEVQGGLEKTLERAFEEIKSRFSRAWILAELANYHFVKGELERGKLALKRALGSARALKNPWARARVLAKLGAALSRLD